MQSIIECFPDYLFYVTQPEVLDTRGIEPIHYRPQQSCGKVIFSQACVKNSVHGEGGCLPQCMLVTAADGTHPTGMHSCHICVCISGISDSVNKPLIKSRELTFCNVL